MGVAHDVMQASTQLSTHLPSTGQQQNTLDQQQQADQQQQQNRHHPLYVSSHMGVGGVQMQPSVQPRVYFHSTGQQQQQQHQQDQQQRVRYPQLPFPRFAHLPPLAVVAPGVFGMELKRWGGLCSGLSCSNIDYWANLACISNSHN